MNDLISIQAAIKILRDWGNPNTPFMDREQAMKMAIDALEAQPQWIPCSERLPEREGRYLVTNSAWGSWTVDVCAWIGHWHSDDKPIAWMELPEEWKGEKDETTI